MKRTVIASLAGAAISLAIWLAPEGRSSIHAQPSQALMAPMVEEQADTAAQPALAGLVSRGAYLARAGNCMGCHTARAGDGAAGRPYAGGHILATSIGTFVTPNITPDTETGIGGWSEEDFWQALNAGKSRNGAPLYPAFPYTDYTKVTREDANAIFAYLQSLPPVVQHNAPNRIDFPFNFRPLLYIWRALYFTQGVYRPASGESDEWNRGAYLVQGLGHCNACHTTRNPLGASQGNVLGGGQIMGSNWYAPSLTSFQEVSTADWTIPEIMRLLKTGLSSRAVTTGPMANVISDSLQHLTDADARAMAVYLKSLPPGAPYSRGAAPALTEEVDKQLRRGGEIYETHCLDCHGNFGQGQPGVYPALAGNRGITLASPINAIRSILNGGYAPVTASNPRPYGMPPFAQILPDDEIALVLSYIRNAWGNRGSMVTAVHVDRSRKGAQ
ncbi:MAG: Cytochrome c, class I [Nitrosospira sp.]